MNINIKTTNGDKFVLEGIVAQTLVSDLKQLIAEKYSASPDQQRLIFKGHILKDEKSIESYGISEGHTIILVKGTKKKDAPAASSAAPSATPSFAPSMASSPPPTTATPAQANPFGAPPASNPFASFMGAPPDMAQMQRQMLQNPEMLSQMMDSPMMRSLMDNPELMQGLMMNNPQIRALMESNPELAHVMNDPNTIRQCLEMARNPELMREMTRNTDRQMSNIEAHPEGFNALRRMYENIQEPMLDAAGPRQDSGNTVISEQRPVNSGSSPDSAPLPNPWAPAQPSPQSSSQPASQPASQQSASSPQGFPSAFGANPYFGMDPNAYAQNPELMMQMLENPMMQQMLQQMLSSPENLENMMNANPMTRQIMESNPGMRELLRNPQLMQAMSNPEALRAMLQLQGAMRGASGAPPAAAAASGGAGPSPPPFNPFAMFGAPNAASAAAPNPFAQSQVRPEILYREQLSSLNAMGFTNAEANLNALIQTGGNLEAAIDRLLQQ